MRKTRGLVDDSFYKETVLSLENDVNGLSSFVNSMSDELLGVRYEKDKNNRKTVTCLSCNIDFESINPAYNKICPACKNVDRAFEYNQYVRLEKKESTIYEKKTESQLWELFFKNIDKLSTKIIDENKQKN